MGHLTNAKGFRVGKSVPWDFREHRFSGEGLGRIPIFETLQIYLKRKIRRYFPAERSGFLFSHCTLRRYANLYLVDLWVFNGLLDTYLRYLRHRFRLVHRRRRHVFNRRYRRLRRTIGRRTFGFFIARRRPFRHRFFGRRRIGLLGLDRRTGRPRSRSKLKRERLRRSEFAFWVADRRKHYSQRFVTRGAYPAMEKLLSRRLSFDFRRVFLPERFLFVVRLRHQSFAHLTASVLGDYIVRRIRLGFAIPRIVLPLLAEARKSPTIKGLFLKFKGRYSRKPRSVVNKKIFRYGCIGFSTVTSQVDYNFRRFETRFGTCSIKIWLARP
jgi:hypothetical protein